jgi:thiamine biosynthesis lipoprotein
LSLGGDVVGEGFDASGEPWTIAIASAFDEGTASDRVIKTNGRRFAAATSGTTIRSGIYKGKNWHHIIDPRTLRPANSDLNMATVYGESAVLMDVLASCAIILGSKKASPFLKRHKATAAFLQGKSDSVIQKQFGKAIQLKVTSHKKKAEHHV